MRHFLKHIVTIIAATLGVFTFAAASAQESSTLKKEMMYLHNQFNVNFVYDSALELDVPYHGVTMKKLC